MKKTIILAMSFCFLLAAVPGYAIHQTLPSETIVGFPGPYAEAVYRFITLEDKYRQWSFWPGKKKMYEGTEPHGKFLTTYINDNARYSIKAGEKMSDGSIIVKENYTEEKKMDSLSVMYKLKGYHPEGGDWFWVKYDPNGKALAEGKVEACIRCHAQKKDNDYVFTGEVVKP